MAGENMRGAGNSAADWTKRFFPLQAMTALEKTASPFATTWVAQQYSQGALTSLNLLESWIANYRTVSDAWRASIRQQQDAMLAATRSQLDSLSAGRPARPDRSASSEQASAPPAKTTASPARETA